MPCKEYLLSSLGWAVSNTILFSFPPNPGHPWPLAVQPSVYQLLDAGPVSVGCECRIFYRFCGYRLHSRQVGTAQKWWHVSSPRRTLGFTCPCLNTLHSQSTQATLSWIVVTVLGFLYSFDKHDQCLYFLILLDHRGMFQHWAAVFPCGLSRSLELEGRVIGDLIPFVIPILSLASCHPPGHASSGPLSSVPSSACLSCAGTR